MGFNFINGLIEKTAGLAGRRKKAPLRDAAGEAGLMLDNLPMAVYWKDADFVYKGANSRFERMAGLESDVLAGKTDFDLHAPEIAERFRQEDMDFASGARKGTYFTDKLVPTPDSREIWARTYKIPIYDESGSLEYILGLIQDVTKIKQSEFALAESEGRLRAILDASSDHIVLVDRGGNILVANSAFLKDFSLDADETSGRPAKDILPYALFEKLSISAQRARAKGAPVELVILPHETPIGKYFSLSVHPVTWDGGDVTAVFAKDITELKLTEAMLLQHSSQLQDAMVESERASKSKSEFLSRMSHEIRTPLNAIIGMAKIANSADDMEKLKECLGKIDNASKHLLGIINDVLDMSKIEAGKFTLANTVFRFENMLRDVVGVVNGQAEEKRQDFEVILDTSMPEFFNADELRLRQVITNLLANAIKFTGEGGKIKLEASHLGVMDDYSLVEISVTDTGIGIAPEQQKKLFQSFEQAEGGIARKYGGTGLGLVICKSIVELMGGRIWIESEPGKGSRFVFNVKLKNHDTGLGAVYPAISFKAMRVLIVDDSLETREYLTAVLEKFGIPCESAEDGDTAVKKTRQAERRGEGFNIFFVDWSMPGMNGIETTRKIKSLMNDSAIVIMISIKEWGEIEKEATDAGVARFMAKPLFPSVVLDILNEIAGTPDANGIKTDGDGVPDLTGYRILLAEDIEINREIAAAILEVTNAEIDFAVNGKTAVEMFNAAKDRYDLILMDIHMPEMDGYEATRQIRGGGDEISSRIPIIAMTADAFKEDIEKCKEIGMNDHVAKPINEKELFRKIQICRLSPRRSSSRPHSLPKLDADGEAPQAINEDEALKRLGGNRELYKNLLRAFLSDPSLLKFGGSIRAGDVGGALEAIHAIKGMAANLSLDALYFEAGKAELALKTDISPQNIPPGLDAEIERTSLEIQRYAGI